MLTNRSFVPKKLASNFREKIEASLMVMKMKKKYCDRCHVDCAHKWSLFDERIVLFAITTYGRLKDGTILCADCLKIYRDNLPVKKSKW